jgi:hypothetical protein
MVRAALSSRWNAGTTEEPRIRVRVCNRRNSASAPCPAGNRDIAAPTWCSGPQKATGAASGSGCAASSRRSFHRHQASAALPPNSAVQMASGQPSPW